MPDTVHLGGRPTTMYRRSSDRVLEIDPLAAGQTALAHGLGETPDGCDLYLECLTAEHGYEEGERVPVAGASMINGNFSPVSVSMDDENVYIGVWQTATADVMDRKGNTPSLTRTETITYANWKLVAVPYINHPWEN